MWWPSLRRGSRGGPLRGPVAVGRITRWPGRLRPVARAPWRAALCFACRLSRAGGSRGGPPRGRQTAGRITRWPGRPCCVVRTLWRAPLCLPFSSPRPPAHALVLRVWPAVACLASPASASPRVCALGGSGAAAAVLPPAAASLAALATPWPRRCSRCAAGLGPPLALCLGSCPLGRAPPSPLAAPAAPPLLFAGVPSRVRPTGGSRARRSRSRALR